MIIADNKVAETPLIILSKIFPQAIHFIYGIIGLYLYWNYRSKNKRRNTKNLWLNKYKNWKI